MSAPALFADLAHGLLDLVFAPECIACRAPLPGEQRERRVCRACWSRARPLPLPRCERCWNPAPSRPAGVEVACLVCPSLPPTLRALRSAWVHEGPVRDLVHALKFRGWWSLSEPLAERMAELPFPLETSEEVRLVVPVPLSPVRFRERGYNQAEHLARAVAARRGWSCRADLLLRTRSTERQATLHPAERRANVTGAFRAGPESAGELRGEHVLLVDDVWTTGATALACGAALIAAGARAFSVLTLARALPELNR